MDFNALSENAKDIINKYAKDPNRLWDHDLAHIPEEERTYEVCMAVVDSDPRALRFVPEKIKTQELCRLAVTKDGRSLEYTPEQFIDRAMCEAVVTEQNSGFGFNYVPDKFKDADMCLKAVSYRGYNLDCVPDNLKTQEICDIALSKNAWALEYVPAQYQNVTNVIPALKSDGRVFTYVKDALKTLEIACIAASSTVKYLDGFTTTRLKDFGENWDEARAIKAIDEVLVKNGVNTLHEALNNPDKKAPFKTVIDALHAVSANVITEKTQEKSADPAELAETIYEAVKKI